ncbi:MULTISPECIES: phosphoethanolamine transferase [unclassified Carboxylicivirga]|uniref:phosphoethanolamine transferase n=1 Tax=Carboxylicivirga TaxID=1628153 RepID=UPI003D33C769
MAKSEKCMQWSIVYLISILSVSVIVGLSNYIRIPLKSLADGISYFLHAAILVGGIMGILYAISINRYVFIIAFPPFVFLTLLSGYYLLFYNITITGAVVDAVLNTDWQVSREFMSVELLFFAVASILAIGFIMRLRLNISPLFRRRILLHIIISVVLILPCIMANALRANTMINRAPFTLLGASQEYLKIKNLNALPRTDVGLDAIVSGKDTLRVILVLGEAVRNDHLGFNGYHRNTTPRLSQREIISFSKTRSLHSYTAASVPQLLTRADINSAEFAYTEESIISILNRCGFQTFWLGNQTPDYTYDGFAKSANWYKNVALTSSSYSDKKWTDENILAHLDEIMPFDGQRTFACLHTIGSHWYYNYRYTNSFKHFVPVTKSRSIHHNSSNEIINAYDNSILFMDYFIDELIKRLEDDNAIMIYMSDHGELLGEDGMWLHAAEHHVLHDAACFIWMSEKFKSKNKAKYRSAKENSAKHFTTSLLFHSILGCCDIKTGVRDDSHNIFSSGNDGL